MNDCSGRTTDFSPRARSALGLLAAALFAGACGHASDHVWVEHLPDSSFGAPTIASSYQIAAGDVIGVRVWGQEGLSIPRLKVREDGKVSLPFIQDVDVLKTTPDELSKRIQTRLKAFIVNPIVTVSVEEVRPLFVSVVGEVQKPGVYELERGAGVIHALAAAGGMTPFAEDDAVFVLRSHAEEAEAKASSRIRFRYRDLRQGRAPASLFRLRSGDVVVVE